MKKKLRMQCQGDMSIRGHRKVWQRGKGVSQCMERGQEGRCQREGEKFGDKMRGVMQRERERERERENHLPTLSCFILFPIK